MYSFKAFNDNEPSGIFLCFEPDLQITYPSSRFTSSIFKEIISVTLIPVAYANSSIALSLIPFKSTSWGCSSSNSTSFEVKILGTRFATFGDWILTVGSLFISFILIKNW